MISTIAKPRHSTSEEITNVVKRPISKNSTFFESGNTCLPLLLSSFHINYRDKILSLTRKKQSIFNNTKSVFKFKETEKLLGKLKVSTGNIELVMIKDKTQKLAEEVSVFNTRNANLVKKLNLIKYISRTRPNNELMSQTNNYFKECEKFIHKYQTKKDKLVKKLTDINLKILTKQQINKKLDNELKRNKNAYLQLRAKHDAYATLKKKTNICEKKSVSLRNLLENDREVTFVVHNIILQNEKVQVDKLQLKIAKYIIENPALHNNDFVRRLVFEAKALEMKTCNL